MDGRCCAQEGGENTKLEHEDHESRIPDGLPQIMAKPKSDVVSQFSEDRAVVHAW